MPVDLTQYPHAMVEDANTGKAMPKVKVEGMDSNSLQPVDIQSRLASTIQTHNGAVVAPTATNYGNYSSTWIDCDGFDKVAIKANSNGAFSWEIQIFWSDDNNSVNGLDAGGASTTNNKVLRVDVAGRYMRIALINRDATNPQTMNATAYLKA